MVRMIRMMIMRLETTMTMITTSADRIRSPGVIWSDLRATGGPPGSRPEPHLGHQESSRLAHLDFENPQCFFVSEDIGDSE